MEQEDKKVLSAFIKRVGMYAPGESNESIISFINGYELGRKNRCKFSIEMSNLLESKYKLKRRAMSWIGQLSEYSEENNLTWSQSFKIIGSELLNQQQE